MGWNSDFTTLAGTSWQSAAAGGVAAMFYAAKEERVYASGQTAFLSGALAAGEPALRSTAGAFGATNHSGGYGRIRSCLGGDLQPPATGDSVTAYFVRRYEADGTTDYVVAGQTALDSPKFESTGSGTWGEINFPAPNGWRRRCRREIYSTTNAGSNGWRARFQTCSSTRWFSVFTGNPLFATLVTTTVGQESNGGKFFDHNGTTWIESADQSSPADILEEYLTTGSYPNTFGSPTRPGYVYPGDIFDGNFANNLRDALNQLTRPCGFFSSPSRSSPGGVVATLESFAATIDGDSLIGNSKAGAVTSTLDAAADAAYNAAVASDGVAPNPASHFYKRHRDADGASSADRTVSALGSRFHVPSVASGGAVTPSSAMPNAEGKDRDIHYYVYALTPPVSVGALEYNDFGTGFAQSTWTEVTPASTGTAATTITGPEVGTVPATSPAGGWPVAADGSRGWGVSPFLVIYVLDWDVNGGFTYTASTP